MRYSFAVVAAAAIAGNAFADERSNYARDCAIWQAEVFVREGSEDGWTTTVSGDSVTYKDSAGNVIDDWSDFGGYSWNGCEDLE